MTPLSRTRKASYVLFGLLVAAVVFLGLGNVAVAGLFSYMILDLTHRALTPRAPAWAARWLSLLVFAIAATALGFMVWSFLKLALQRLPVIVVSVMPKIDELAMQYGVELPFDNLRELRELLLDAMRTNLRSITHASGLLGKGFFQVVVGVFVAIFCFMGEHPAPTQPNFFDATRRELDARIEIFMVGFEKIFGAQVIISAINTCITGVFLLVIGMPYSHFLVLACFLLGILPIVGNVTSNTIIVGTALTVSPQLAVFTFIFLVVSHKIEYFLNSQIMGARINTPVWQVLIGLIVGEAVMGFTGMILAPAMIHYIREEMVAVPYEDSGARSAAAL